MKYLSHNIFLVIALVLLSFSCQDLKNQTVEKDLVDAETLEEKVEDVSIKPVEGEKGQFKLSIKFNSALKNVNMPDALVLCGSTNEKLTPVSRDGEVNYAGITSSSLIEQLYNNAVGNKPIDMVQGPYADCSVSFTSPGEYDANCGETCSDTSLLGGDTWFCVCVTDCRIGWQW